MSSVAIASPNIAFIKYWGKITPVTQDDINIGLNPSLSMTLSQAQTRCELTLKEGSKNEIFINDKPASERDVLKITEHLARVCKFFSKPLMGAQVRSYNNFPQGVGLASSASAFCALTLAAVAELYGKEEAQKFLVDAEKNKILSRLSRLGSGSASRSTLGAFMYWDGAFATPFKSAYKLYDTIVIFSKEHKKVSSREGHKLATSSPQFPKRLHRVPKRMELVKEALLKKDLHKLGPIIEEEALEMHRIAESSHPSVEYLTPESRLFLTKLQTLSPRHFYFTLDAGPNVHLISEEPIRNEVQSLLTEWGMQAEIWEDWTGSGPVLG